MRLHHLALKARDPERVAAFYRDVLGLSEHRRHHDARGLRSIWLDLEPGVLMVERADAEGPGADARPFAEDPPGWHLLALALPRGERAAWRRRLDEAGVRVEHETEYTLYVRDPEGHRVGLSELDWAETLTSPA